MKEKIEVILVDIGNTRLKSVEVVDGMPGDTRSWSDFDSLASSYPSNVPFIVCNTSSMKVSRANTTIISAEMALPIQLNYHTPTTLGTDRIAAAVGCYALFPGRNSLIIDLGTCMTADFVSSEGVFEGGIISPGLTMRMKSMSTFTANLPDISNEWEKIEHLSFGKTTKECLLAGSFGGLLSEITGFISKFSQEFTSINVIVTGGDAHYFESFLKARTFAGSKIVMTGLYHIWKHQLING